ncbi:hypothetical protein MRX96_058723 [Rhipicephalus microplus]
MQVTSSKTSPGSYSSLVQGLVFSGSTLSLTLNIESTTAASVTTSTLLPTVHGELFPWLTQLANATTTNVPTTAPVAIGGLLVPVLQPSMTRGTTKKRKRTASSARYHRSKEIHMKGQLYLQTATIAVKDVT